MNDLADEIKKVAESAMGKSITAQRDAGLTPNESMLSALCFSANLATEYEKKGVMDTKTAALFRDICGRLSAPIIAEIAPELKGLVPE